MARSLKFVGLLIYFLSASSALDMMKPNNFKTWSFEYVGLETNSSNKDLVDFQVELTRKARNSYGVTGTIKLNKDVTEKENVHVAATVYRSATGSSDYTVTPFTVQKQHLLEFFNTFYKDYLMKSLKDCSDLPQFTSKIESPLKAKTYNLDNCLISNEGLPPHMLEGFYKIIVAGTGEVDFALNLIVKVEKDAM